MNKVILAIQTPRAGELHFLWITPFVNGESISDTELGELLSKLRKQLPKDVKTDAPSSLDSPKLSEALSSGELHNSYYNDDSSDNEDYDSPSDFPVGQLQENDNAVNSDASDSSDDDLSETVNSDVKEKRVEGVVVKDGMLFSRQVIQTSSGRPGNEELFLYAFGFGKSVPEDKRNECSEKLSAFFNDKLEGIIKTIDWKKAARDSSVHSSVDLKNLADGLSSPLAAFDSLYSDLADLLNPFIKEPEPEPEPIDNKPEPPEKPKSGKSDTQSDAPKPKKTSFFKYVLGLCIIIALLIPIVVMAQSGTFGEAIKQKTENWIKNAKETAQDLFKLPKTSSISDDDFNKIWSELYTFPDNVKQEERETLVKEAIVQTYRYYWGVNPKGDECKLDNGSFTQKIKDLIKQKAPIILSDQRLNDSEFECFGNVKPEEFRRLVNEYIQAQSMLETMINDYSIPAGQKAELKKKIDISSFKWNSDVYPCFFFNRNKDVNDVVIAKKLKSIFEDSAINKAIQRFNDSDAVYMDGANEKQCFKLYNQWDQFKFEERIEKMFPDLNP